MAVEGVWASKSAQPLDSSQPPGCSNPSSNECWSSPNGHFCSATSPCRLPATSLTFGALPPALQERSTFHNRFAAARSCQRLLRGTAHAPSWSLPSVFPLPVLSARTTGPWPRSSSKQAPTWSANRQVPSPLLLPSGFSARMLEASEVHRPYPWSVPVVAAIPPPSRQPSWWSYPISSAGRIAPTAWFSFVVPVRCPSFSSFQALRPSMAADLATSAALDP